MQATPMTLDQVVGKLNSIPAFIIVNEKGQPLVSTIRGNSVVGVFFSPKDATAFLDISLKNPKLTDEQKTGLKVAAIPFGDLYRRTKLVGSEKLNLGLVGAASEQTTADREAKKLDPKVTTFERVPLYAGKVKGSGYMTFAVDGKPVIPLFFSRADLEAKVADAVKANPAMKDKIEIELTSLEGVISLMETADAKQTNPLGFVLLPDVREYLSKSRGG